MNSDTEFRGGLGELTSHYEKILSLPDEDPQRESLQKTPMRVAKTI